MDKEINKLVQQTETICFDFGNYIVMRNAAKGVQYFGSADVLIFSLSLISWSLVEVYKGFLKEKGKQLAQVKKEKLNQEELLDQINNVFGEVIKRRNNRSVDYVISHEKLVAKLIQLDFTERAAIKAAKRLKPLFEKEINEILKKGIS